MRVLIDLVVNHTSDQHPWFQDARRDPRVEVPRLVRLVEEEAARTPNEGMVFPGVQKSTWSYDKRRTAWYFHRFYDFQPDLNTANPEVQAEILKIMGFWIAARRLGLPHGCGAVRDRTQRAPTCRSRKSSTTCCAHFREFLQWRQGDSIILAEANVLPEDRPGVLRRGRRAACR